MKQCTFSIFVYPTCYLFFTLSKSRDIFTLLVLGIEIRSGSRRSRNKKARTFRTGSWSWNPSAELLRYLMKERLVGIMGIYLLVADVDVIDFSTILHAKTYSCGKACTYGVYSASLVCLCFLVCVNHNAVDMAT
ncbi:hypothetical protein VNO78_12622 [Psophocarpus tetragonolobus]|uniref:Uncharacterized protein n=1 Tax=Psophocarpus tetragonolobus TaxID=3891 RepID=A0AAN9SVV7_PSOTE